MSSLVSNITVSINFYFLVAISIFWAFFLNFGLNSGLGFFIFSILTLLYVLYSTYRYINSLIIKIHIHNLIIPLIVCSLIGVLMYSFNAPISGDQLFHLLNTYQIPIGILNIMNLDMLEGIAIQTIFYVYSCLVLAGIILAQLIFSKNKIAFFTIFSILAFVLITSKLFINPDIAHPELRTLPLAILGSISINEEIYKIQSLAPIFILILYLLHCKNDIKLIILVVTTILFLPIINFNLGNIEFSVRTMFSNTIVLLHVHHKKTSITLRDVMLLSILISIFSLIRISSAFAFLPLFTYLILINRKDLILKALPISLIAFVQIINSMASDYPAISDTDLLFLERFALSETTIIQKIIYSFDPIFLKHKLENMTILGSLLVLAGMVHRDGKFLIFIIIFLGIYWVIFHQLSIILWGLPRYLMEYLIPISILGVKNIFYLIKTRHLVYLIFLAFTTSINSFNSLVERDNFSVKYPFSYERNVVIDKFEDMVMLNPKFISVELYDWSSAIKELDSDCFGIYKADINIGVFPLAFIPSVSVREFIQSHKITGNSNVSGVYCTLEWAKGNKGLGYLKEWDTSLEFKKLN